MMETSCIIAFQVQGYGRKPTIQSGAGTIEALKVQSVVAMQDVSASASLALAHDVPPAVICRASMETCTR